MSTIAELMVKIGVDMNGFAQGMNKVQTQLKTFGDSATKVGTKLTVGLTAPLVAFGVKAIQTASDLAEVQNVVDVTFGKSAKTINAWSKDAMKAYGLTELQAKQMSSSMGAMTKSMGLSDEQMQTMAMSLTGLAGDMSSFYNLPHDVTWEKIRSGIAGETEPLKQLGINMSVAALESFALEQGITKTYESMTEAEKVTLRYNFLMKATADAQGDFARTSEGFANQWRIMQGELTNLGATIGTILLPYALELVKWLGDLITKFQELSPQQQDMVVKLGLVAAAIGPLLIIIGQLSTGISALVGTIAKFSAAPLISGLGAVSIPAAAVVLSVGAIGVAVYQLWTDNQEFRDDMKVIWGDIERSMTTVTDTITTKMIELGLIMDENGQKMQNSNYTVWETIKLNISSALQTIGQFIAYFLNMFTLDFEGAGYNVQAMWKELMGFLWRNTDDTTKSILLLFKMLWEQMKEETRIAWDNLVKKIKGSGEDAKTAAKDVAKGIIDGMVNGIEAGYTQVIEAAKTLAGKLPEWVKKVLQIKSPSQVFFEIGTNTTQGLTNGITAGTSGVYQAMMGCTKNVVDLTNSMLNTTNSAIQSFTPSIVESAKALGNNVATGLGEGLKTIDDMIAQAMTRINTAVKQASNNNWFGGSSTWQSTTPMASSSILKTSLESTYTPTQIPAKSSSTNININTMNVRKDSDIPLIAQELYRLQNINSRVRGLA